MAYTFWLGLARINALQFINNLRIVEEELTESENAIMDEKTLKVIF